jgi:hypothetical protein
MEAHYRGPSPYRIQTTPVLASLLIIPASSPRADIRYCYHILVRVVAHNHPTMLLMGLSFTRSNQAVLHEAGRDTSPRGQDPE